MKILSFATSVLIGAAALVTRAHAVDVDPQLPAYKPVPVGSAQITSVGSDTLGDLMRSWADEFAKLNPNVKIEVESKGSSTRLPRCLMGWLATRADVASNAKRRVGAVREKIRLSSTSFPVAVDALAVYVNKDNPIECLTLRQLDDIFSKAYLHPGGTNIRTWGDAGLTGDWAAAPISLSVGIRPRHTRHLGSSRS